MAMLIITYFGSYLMISGLTFISVIYFYIHKYTTSIFPFLITICGSTVTTFILKALINRTRPSLNFMIYLENSPSFPSGHATAAMALYGFFIYMIYFHFIQASQNKNLLLYKFLFVFFIALIILVGVSRIYLGHHYLSDVLVGYAIGLVWIFIGAKLQNKIEKLLNWKPKIS